MLTSVGGLGNICADWPESRSGQCAVLILPPGLIFLRLPLLLFIFIVMCNQYMYYIAILLICDSVTTFCFTYTTLNYLLCAHCPQLCLVWGPLYGIVTHAMRMHGHIKLCEDEYGKWNRIATMAFHWSAPSAEFHYMALTPTLLLEGRPTASGARSVADLDTLNDRSSTLKYWRSACGRLAHAG